MYTTNGLKKITTDRSRLLIVFIIWDRINLFLSCGGLKTLKMGKMSFFMGNRLWVCELW